MKSFSTHQTQQGAVTLLTALILLLCITLVTLFASKNRAGGNPDSADNYRMAQAVAAANAAMDFGVGYFDNGGFDQKINATGADGSDSIVDTIADRAYNSTDGTQTTTASLTFNNAAGTRCVAAVQPKHEKRPDYCGRPQRRRIGGQDNYPMRWDYRCIWRQRPQAILNIARCVGLTGNYQIINRYYNTTAWAGNAVNIGEIRQRIDLSSAYWHQ